jgi:tetratricopeptide (TPR) repeat protein
MRTLSAVLCLMLGVALASSAVELPEELKHLAPALENEEQTVEAVRALHMEKWKFHQEVEAKKMFWEGPGEELKQLIDQAQAGLQLTRTAYELALASYPNNARLHNYLGELLYDGFDDQPAALREWNLALSHDSKLSSAYNNIGIYLTHVGQYKEGLRHLDRALELDPEHSDYLYNLVQTYLTNTPQVAEIRGWKEEKVCREALKLSKKAAKLSPDDFSLQRDHALNFHVVINYGYDVNLKEAAAAWETARAKASTPDQKLESWLHEARLWLGAKDKENSLRCLEEARKLRPESEVIARLTKQAQELS